MCHFIAIMNVLRIMLCMFLFMEYYHTDNIAFLFLGGIYQVIIIVLLYTRK